MENHTVVSGLGAEVAWVIAQHGLGKKLYRIGLEDTYAHGGSQNYLMNYYGLDAMALTRKIESILDTRFSISKKDLAEVRLNKTFGEDQLEAL